MRASFSVLRQIPPYDQVHHPALVSVGFPTLIAHRRCGAVVHKVSLSGRGEIVVCTLADIFVYSINGVLLAQCPCEDKLTGMQVVPPPTMGTRCGWRHFPSLIPVIPCSAQMARPESDSSSRLAITSSSGAWTTSPPFISWTTICVPSTFPRPPSPRFPSSPSRLLKMPNGGP